MKKTALALAVLAFCATASRADEPSYVYYIQRLGGGSASAWDMNMAAADAARLYSPSSFKKKDGGIELASDAAFSLSIGEAEVVERSDTRLLMRARLDAAGLPALPKPDKRLTVRFSLKDLVRDGGAASESPLLFALRKAVLGASWVSGSAWIESVAYKGDRFVVVVALKKR